MSPYLLRRRSNRLSPCVGVVLCCVYRCVRNRTMGKELVMCSSSGVAGCSCCLQNGQVGGGEYWNQVMRQDSWSCVWDVFTTWCSYEQVICCEQLFRLEAKCSTMKATLFEQWALGAFPPGPDLTILTGQWVNFTPGVSLNYNIINYLKC